MTEDQVAGLLLQTFVSAFEDVKAINKYETNDLLRDIEGSHWYSISKLDEIVGKLKTRGVVEESQFFEAGVRFMQNWYAQGGHSIISNVNDYIELQRDSRGYNLVVRSSRNTQFTDVVYHDKEKCEALISLRTFLDPEFVKGVCYSGMQLTGDVSSVEFEIINQKSTDDTRYFDCELLIKYYLKPDESIIEKIAQLTKDPETGCRAELTSEELKYLLYSRKRLLADFTRREAYWANIHRRLKTATEEPHHSQQKYEYLANRDHLTGTLNQRKIEELVKHELDLKSRYTKSVSLILIDFDNFKCINQKHGHEAGDYTLVTAVNLIAAELRKTDFISRLGGDEFALLLPETALDGAKIKAESLLKTIREFRFVYNDQQLSVSLGAGIAEASKDDSRSTFFKRADDALQQSKEQGKDRVSVAEPSA